MEKNKEPLKQKVDHNNEQDNGNLIIGLAVLILIIAALISFVWMIVIFCHGGPKGSLETGIVIAGMASAVLFLGAITTPLS